MIERAMFDLQIRGQLTGHADEAVRPCHMTA